MEHMTDSKDNFRFLSDDGIEPCIKVRKNSSINARGCMPRKIAVMEQLKDTWKERHVYMLRWIAESAISSLKRTFGEYVSSIRWSNNIVKELILKASIYNIFIRMSNNGNNS